MNSHTNRKMLSIAILSVALVVGIPRPAACELLTDKGARNLAAEFDAIEHKMVELSARASRQDALIKSLASYREQLYAGWKSGEVASTDALRAINALRPIDYGGIFRSTGEKVVIWTIEKAYEFDASVIRRNLRARKSSVDDRDKFDRLKEHVDQVDQALDRRAAEIAGAKTLLKQLGLIAPPEQVRPPLSADSLLAGACIAVDAWNPANPDPSLVLTVKQFDPQTQKFEGVISYPKDPMSTQIVGWREGEVLLFREVKLLVASFDAWQTVGRVWRLRPSDNETLVGNVRQLGYIRDPNVQWPPYEPVGLATPGPSNTGMTLHMVSAPAEHSDICTEDNWAELAAQRATYVGVIEGSFLGDATGPGSREDSYSPGSHEVLFKVLRATGGFYGVIECQEEAMAGLSATVSGVSGAGVVIGSLKSPYLLINGRAAETSISLRCLDGGRVLVGEWRGASGTWRAGPYRISLKRK